MATPLNDPPIVRIQTTLLYGVFASHRSFLIGTRNLVKREYATWLAKKATGEKLPQELVDIVTEELYRLEEATVNAQWKKIVPFANNAAYFARAPNDTKSYRAAMRKIKDVAPGVEYTIVCNDRPHLDGVPKARETVTYMHLSAVRQRPRLALSLPPNSPSLTSNIARSPLIYASGGQGLAAVSLRQGYDLSQDSAAYRRSEDRSQRGLDPLPQISRLLMCDGVEEAMRDWDAEALKKFVDLLGLKVVPFEREGDPMKPGLHVLQTLEDV